MDKYFSIELNDSSSNKNKVYEWILHEFSLHNDLMNTCHPTEHT